MKKICCIIVVLVVFISCNTKKPKEKESVKVKSKFTEIITPDYEVYKPNQKAKAVLILFGGFPEVAEDIKREFTILEIARKNNVAVLFSNLNQKLWLQEDEKRLLAQKLQDVFVQNELPFDNIFIGGFSSGGIVSLLISDFIIGMKQFYIDPKGVFIVDSPIDLAELYEISEGNIVANFSETSVEESKWLIETLGSEFGNPKTDIETYEKYSVYTLRTHTIDNVKKLKNTKIRLYTEPDIIWWKKHRMVTYEQMNAFPIQKLSEDLKKQGFKYVEYISTSNRGYRANGERHPHSWSIVDENDLMKWMLEK